MAVAFQSLGTVGTGSTSVTAGLPASLATGDGVLLRILTKPDTATVATPSGWTLVVDVAGGGGSNGNGVGPTRQTVFFREKDAGWSTMPAVTVTSGNSTAAVAERWTKNTGQTWSIAAASGAYSGDATSWSAAMDVDPGIAFGDAVSVGCSNQDDAPTWSAQGITATGATFGSVTERSDVVSTTTGFDIGGMVFTAAVTAGTATAVATVTATTSANSRGTTALVRLREVAPPPIASYSFSDGTGTTVTDDTGNGHSLTFRETTNTTWGTGKNGSGLTVAGKLSGTGAWTTTFPTISTNKITLLGWVKRTSNPASGLEPAFGFWATDATEPVSASSQACFWFERNNFGTADRLQANLRTSGSGLVSLAHTSDLTVGTWVHVAFTYDGATYALYVDGALSTSGAPNGTLTPGSKFIVGAQSDASYDDIAVYDVALNQAQIVAAKDATGATAATGTATLTLSGSATAEGSAAATASLTLGGTATAAEGGTPATATASLALAATATAVAAAGASAGFALAASADTAGGAVATGTLVLTATAAVAAVASLAAAIVLAASADAAGYVTATATLALTGSATPRAPTTATAELTLAGTATAGTPGATPATASAVVTLSASVAGVAVGGGSAFLTLSGAASAAADAAATAGLILTATTTAAGAAVSAASLTLTATANATAIGENDATANPDAHLTLDPVTAHLTLDPVTATLEVT